MSEEHDNTRQNHGTKTFSQECPYFGKSIESKIEAFMAHRRELSWYDKYLKLGYRRIADIYYKNICTNCQKCISIRVLVDSFVFSKSQQKTFNKNSDIVLSIKKSYQITDEHIDLYNRYITKHGGNINETIDNIHSIHLGYSHTLAMEYYLDNTLVAVSIIDETKEALSSVYCYYDYRLEKRRLGIYTLLKEIEFAKSIKKKYCYLGFYIEELNSMNYKASFMPNEVLNKDKWALYNSL